MKASTGAQKTTRSLTTSASRCVDPWAGCQGPSSTPDSACYETRLLRVSLQHSPEGPSESDKSQDVFWLASATMDSQGSKDGCRQKGNSSPTRGEGEAVEQRPVDPDPASLSAGEESSASATCASVGTPEGRFEPAAVAAAVCSGKVKRLAPRHRLDRHLVYLAQAILSRQEEAEVKVQLCCWSSRRPSIPQTCV